MKTLVTTLLLFTAAIAASWVAFFHSSTSSSLPVRASSAGMQSKSNQNANVPHSQVPSPHQRVLPDKETTVKIQNLPLAFEANQGQANASVKFLSRGSGYTMFLTSNQTILALRRHQTMESGSEKKKKRSDSVGLRINLMGATVGPKISALDELPGKSNYFIGNDPKQWRTNVRTYARVKYQNVYPGIDLIYYGNQGQLEHDFVVAPGADPNAIKLDIRDANLRGPPVSQRSDNDTSLRVNSRGELLLRVAGGVVHFHKPVVYQIAHAAAKTYIDGHYVLASDHTVSFAVANYDPSQPLVIDPVLTYSTYLGAESLDTGNAVAVDSTGSVYVTGETASMNFPTLGAFQGSSAGASDVFVSKIDSSGANLVYSTYLGGSLSERGNSIALDPAGNACVTGRTNSDNFPLMNAWQSQLFGDFDAFVTELNAQGNGLIFSTYLGGAGNDEGSGVAVDSLGEIYVTGGVSAASGDNFPTTSGAFQRLFGGGMNDAFVTKFDPAQSGSATLVYSTFLGGNDIDRGNSIAVDSSGNAYITGRTRSTDFPTRNPLQATYGGGDYDVFVTELNSTATDVVYSTYIGGGGTDQGYGITVDSAGNAYVTGETASVNFPTTANAFQSANAGSSDAFMAKIDSTGSSLVYSTYFGGSGTDLASGIATDTSGIAYITGRTSTTSGFPTTPDAIQPNFGGGPNDVFIAKINPSQSGAASLVYSTYLGGGGDENIPSVGPGGNPSGGIAVDSAGNIYVTGNTSSANFPSVNPYQTTYGGGPSDAFIARIANATTAPDYSVSATPASLTVIPGGTANYTVTVSPVGGFTGSVDLSVGALPANSTGTFNPPSVIITDASSQTSTLMVGTTASTPLGSFALNIATMSGALQHTASATLAVTDATGSADLMLTKNASSNPVEVGTNLSYGIKAINQGPAVATGVQVTDTLPSATFVSATSTQGACSGTSTVTCNVGILAVGGVATITIVVTPQAIGSISNMAKIAGNQPDPNPDNNSATVTTTVEASCPAPGPCMLDPNLAVNTVVAGLAEPTGIAFLGPGDFLVLEKSTGKVKHVVGGVVQGIALDLAVNSASERGLLGIALHPDFATNGYVYLYWTCRGQPAAADCDSLFGADTTDIAQVPILGNRVDRFIWNAPTATLTLDRNLIRLHSYQQDADANGNFNQPRRGNHNGGKIIFGPDGKLYILIGDNGRRGNLQNISTGVLPNGMDDQFGGPGPDNIHFTGVILRLNDDGSTPVDNAFYEVGGQIGGEAGANIQRIFAYGVRNSFGMAFDPLSGKLWNEENGDDSFDEINMIPAAANNGWVQTMGPVGRIADYKAIETSPQYFGLQQVRWPPTLVADTPEDALARLFMLPGAFYNDPLFSWKYAVAPSPIGFVVGNGLGARYSGDMFVGAARTFLSGGYLFDFKLTADRSDLDLSADSRLADRVADNTDKFDITESESLLIGRDFGITTDIQAAPSGTLYVVSLSNGAVYEIALRP